MKYKKTKELLQYTWWAFLRGFRGPPGGPQGSTAPQFGKHCLKSKIKREQKEHFAIVVQRQFNYLNDGNGTKSTSAYVVGFG